MPSVVALLFLKNVEATYEVGGGGAGLVPGGKVPVAGRGTRCCSSSVGFVSGEMKLRCLLCLPSHWNMLKVH